MQYKKLTPGQIQTLKWRATRNAIVSKLLEEDKFLLRADALKRANQIMRRRGRD